jgi:hypothetical protein
MIKIFIFHSAGQTIDKLNNSYCAFLLLQKAKEEMLIF